MKACRKFIFAALAATAMLAGCAKEITPPNFENDKINPAAEGSRVIAVAFAPQTKTTLENGFYPKFADGDSILISNGNALDTCEVKGETISTDLTGPLTAVYPYKAAKMNENNENRIDTVLVSTEQSGLFADANICMAVMENENDESLSFKNKTAVFCITPGAGDNTQYVEVTAAAGFNIANNIPTGSANAYSSTIRVATTSADSVYVSILVPASLKIGDLKFSDGTNEKIITGDKAATEIAAGTLYTVTNANWTEPEPEVEYVEIGERKWATKNLGAATETDFGKYFGWGDKTGYALTSTAAASPFDGSTINNAFEGAHSFSTKPSIDGETQNPTTLPVSNDAATIYLGSGWRMPTSQDFQDLYEACGGSGSGCTPSTLSSAYPDQGIYWLSESQDYISDYTGVAGLLFVDGSKNKLFFPAAGLGNGTSLNNAGSFGRYWSSSLYSDNTDYAYYLYFNSSGVYPQYNYYRYRGFSVRPVSD